MRAVRIYVAPCDDCCAAYGEFYVTNGRPILLTPAGREHAARVLRFVADRPWLARGKGPAMRDLAVALTGPATKAERDHEPMAVVAIRRECAVCGHLGELLGEDAPLVRPASVLLIGRALVAMREIRPDSRSKAVTSARILRPAGFDPVPPDLLAPDPRGVA